MQASCRPAPKVSVASVILRLQSLTNGTGSVGTGRRVPVNIHCRHRVKLIWRAAANRVSLLEPMKNATFWSFGLALALAAVPLGGGCDQEPANSAPADAANTNQESAAIADTSTDTAAAAAAEQQLENAPGQIVSSATPPAPAVNLNGPAAEVVKLAQAGVEEVVMLSFVTNAPNTFNLSSDAIIYLNDIGVPGTVVTAMLQHDQTVKGRSSSSLVTSAPPIYTNPLVPTPGTPAPYPSPNAVPDTTEAQASPPEATDNTEASPPPNTSSTYFHDSLAPYGNWINVAGYGPCWQPTAVVVNPGWQPYCNSGHWVYSDCGWYWVSDYSWGWAPFHYGRWFRHNQWGWCWAPDTVWGPSWVSWRYTEGYCGWAPLPPTACFTPGIGFTYFGHHVGFGFSFGLGANCYAFVPIDHFFDHHPHRYRVPSNNVNHFYNHTVVVNQIVEGNNRTIINRGIPVRHMAEVTHLDIHTVHVRDVANPVTARAERGDRGGQTLPAYRPNLPAPGHRTALVGEGVRPDWHNPGIVRPGTPPAIAPRQQPGAVNSQPHGRRPETVPVFRNPPSTPTEAVPRPDRSTSPRDAGPRTSLPATKQPSWTPPPTPAQPAAPVQRPASQQNNPRASLNPDLRQFTPAPNPVERPHPGVFRGEASQFGQPDGSAFRQPSPSAPREPQFQVRANPWTPAVQARPPQRWSNPAPERTAPPMQMHQSPSAQTGPAAQRSTYSAPAWHGSQPNDPGSRQNR